MRSAALVLLISAMPALAAGPLPEEERAKLVAEVAEMYKASVSALQVTAKDSRIASERDRASKQLVALKANPLLAAGTIGHRSLPGQFGPLASTAGIDPRAVNGATEVEIKHPFTHAGRTSDVTAYLRIDPPVPFTKGQKTVQLPGLYRVVGPVKVGGQDGLDLQRVEIKAGEIPGVPAWAPKP